MPAIILAPIVLHTPSPRPEIASPVTLHQRVAPSAPSLSQTLQDHLPYTLLSSGGPSQLSQLRGLGLRSDETVIQSDGLVLNPAYGGGVNLSTFPAALFSEWRWQSAMGSPSFDARALGGSLDLRLFGDPQSGAPSTRLLTSTHREITTLAMGTRENHTGVTLVGQLGSSRGGAWHLHQDVLTSSTARWSVGTLGSAFQQDSEGSRFYPTPYGRLTTHRALIFTDYRRDWGETDPSRVRVLSGVDISGTDAWENVRDPSDTAYSQRAVVPWLDHSWNLPLDAEWTLIPSQSLRWISYRAGAPSSLPELATQQALAVQWRSQTWTLVPRAGVMSLGEHVAPMVSLDSTHRTTDAVSRLSLTYQTRMPSAQDRRFTQAGFALANPDLKPEVAVQLLGQQTWNWDLSEVMGAASRLSLLLEAQTQRRLLTHTTQFATQGGISGIQTVNGGGAWLTSATLHSALTANHWLAPQAALTWQRLSFDDASRKAVGLPTWMAQGAVEVSPTSDPERFSITPSVRFQSPAWSAFPEQWGLPTTVVALAGMARVGPARFTLRVDHLLGSLGRSQAHPQEWVLGYPIPEQLISAGIEVLL